MSFIAMKESCKIAE